MGLDRRTYEAIPYKEVGGTPRFVNGKHTGLAHVRSLLAERTKQLGFKADREIALRVVEAIKRIRERRAEAADFARWIRQYYSELGRLGISDDEVIEVAMELTQQETMVAADDSKRAASEGL